MGDADFRVVAEGLVDAARALNALSDLVPGRFIEGLSLARTGHDRLQTVLGDFTARWQEGVDALAADSRATAVSLKTAAENYVHMDLETAAMFLSLKVSDTP